MLPNSALLTDAFSSLRMRCGKTRTLGRFVFLCDNFCGEGHDHMTGWLVVEK